MSIRIPAVLKAELGEYLASLYRRYGIVAPRRPYHEDDKGGDSGAANAAPLFVEHPFLSEMPIGASSDLASVLVNDQRTLDETDKRSEELTLELKNKLELQLGQKHQKKFLYQQYIKPGL